MENIVLRFNFEKQLFIWLRYFNISSGLRTAYIVYKKISADFQLESCSGVN